MAGSLFLDFGNSKVRISVLFLTVQLFFACVENSHRIEARSASDNLLERIGKGTAYEYFPEKYFPKAQSDKLLSDLKVNCDFANRRGGFVNDFYQKRIGGEDEISFIYEFYLKCDSIRIITTYNIGSKMEVRRFKLEPIEKGNSMLLKK